MAEPNQQNVAVCRSISGIQESKIQKKRKKVLFMAQKYPPKKAEPKVKVQNPVPEEWSDAFLELCGTVQSPAGASAALLAYCEAGGDLNWQDEQGTSLLFWAASAGETATAAFLIEKGAVPDLADIRGWTPLYAASYYGKWETCRLLVEKGANANARQSDGWSVLHHAVRRGNTEMVHFLIQNGADPNIADEDGETLLHTAAYSENAQIVKSLLENGADPNAADEDGWTVLHAACRSGKLEIVRLLVDDFRANVHAEDTDGETPLDYLRSLIEEAEDDFSIEEETARQIAEWREVESFLLSVG